ncbi:MAG TPA: DUF4185 domain-containing protein [Arenibaculum sp.]|nr:DUF4185 domain-containing protein [Arenibaculum sp.]
MNGIGTIRLRRIPGGPLALLLALSLALSLGGTFSSLDARSFPSSGDPAVRTEPGSTRKICQVVGETDRRTGARTVNATETNYGFWGTDLGASFEHEGELYFLFGDTHASGGLKRPRDADLIAVSRDDDPEDCIEMSFITDEDGGYRPLTIPGVSSGAFSVPTGGVSVNGEIHVFATTDFSPANPMGRSVLASSGDKGRTFEFRHTVSSGKFINVAPVVVDGATVAGLPQSAGDAVLLWASGRYRRSDPYLAAVPADRIAEPGEVRYFAGIDPASGRPRWSRDEPDAAPLFPESCLGELSVGWNPYLERWLMLYNCGTPRNRIYIRSAKLPWGPWSEPDILFDPERDGGYCNFMNAGPRVVTVSTSGTACGSVSDPHTPDRAGDAYGPYLIPRFTRGTPGQTSDIYYLMSTWNPYTVVLMRSTLSIGDDGGGLPQADTSRVW